MNTESATFWGNCNGSSPPESEVSVIRAQFVSVFLPEIGT